MKYSEIMSAIKRVTSEKSCTVVRKEKLEAMSKNISNMPPEEPANGAVVGEFMRTAGFMGK